MVGRAASNCTSSCERRRAPRHPWDSGAFRASDAEAGDNDVRAFQSSRHAYLDVGIALARFDPQQGGGAEEMLPYARERGKPVLLPDA